MCTYGRDARDVYLCKGCVGSIPKRKEGCVPMEGRDVHYLWKERDDVYLYYIGTHPFLC